MCIVLNYVGKGNIFEEIVEVLLVFINFLFKRRDVLLFLWFNLFILLFGYI